MIIFVRGVSNEFISQYKKAIQHLNNYNIGINASRLEKSKIIYAVAECESGKGSSFNTKTRTITWCPKDGLLNPNTGIVISPTTALNHELAHANNYNKAMLNPIIKNKFFNECEKDPNNPYGSKEDQIVITGIEQITAKLLGEIKEGEYTRCNHGGILLPTENVISNKLLKKKC